MKHAISLSILCAAAASANASPVVVGAALGSESQTAMSPLGLLLPPLDDARNASLTVMRLHAGTSVARGWIEPGIDLEVGEGNGLRSLGAYFVLRTHVAPEWRVHPTLEIGAGGVSEHGTMPGDEATGFRRSFLLGPGIEARVNSQWMIGLEARIVTVAVDQFEYAQGNDTVTYYMAHGALIDSSFRLGATYQF